jgi:hypothetical protein
MCSIHLIQYGRRKRILRHGPSLNNSAPPINIGERKPLTLGPSSDPAVTDVGLCRDTHTGTKIADDVKPRRSFVVGLHDAPGSKYTVSSRKHFVSRFRVLLPEFMGLRVNQAKFPLPEWVCSRKLRRTVTLPSALTP